MACRADGLDTRWHIWHVGGIGDWSDCSAIDCGSGYTPSFRLENEGVFSKSLITPFIFQEVSTLPHTKSQALPPSQNEVLRPASQRYDQGMAYYRPRH